MRTMTGVVSLADPLKDGEVLFDGDGGAFKVTVGEFVSTMNVRGSLTPEGFPIELSWVAIAVYCPLASAGLAPPEVQSPPVPEAVAVETTAPFVVAPAWIWTVTGVVSLAKPLNDGVVSLDGETGWSNVTVGELVSTVNVTGALSLLRVSVNAAPAVEANVTWAVKVTARSVTRDRCAAPPLTCACATRGAGTATVTVKLVTALRPTLSVARMNSVAEPGGPAGLTPSSRLAIH